MPATGTSPASLRDLDETKALKFTDGGRDRISVDTIFDQMIVGELQLAVVVAAVLLKLDLDAGKNTMGGKRQDAVGRALEHFDQPRRERAIDLVAAMVAPLAHGSISASRTSTSSI